MLIYSSDVTRASAARPICATVNQQQPWMRMANHKLSRHTVRGVYATLSYFAAFDHSSVFSFSRSLYYMFSSVRSSSFYPRDAMLSRVLAMALCLSVSVWHKPVLCRNG